MHIETSTVEGVTFLSVAGEVDLATADDLREAGIRALNPIGGTLRIDLAQVTFMDSTGLAALVAIRNHGGDAHRVVVANPRRNVRRILEVTGLDQVFESAESRTVGPS